MIEFLVKNSPLVLQKLVVLLVLWILPIPMVIAEINFALTLNEQNLSNFVWPSQGVIEGNVLLESGCWDFNGKTLKIKGHLLQAGGDLSLSTGQLEVTGDYRLQAVTATGYRSSLGRLLMTEAEGLLRVKGDFVVDSQLANAALTAGRLMVEGNFTQQSTDPLAVPTNFVASADHQVLLAGTQTQVVQFEDLHHSGFAHLTISNPTPYAIRFQPELPRLRTLTHPWDKLYLPEWTIQHGILQLPADWQVALPTGQALHLAGGALHLNGHRLQLEADLVQSGGELDIGTGQLHIKGDYRLQTPSVAGYKPSTGRFYMTHDAGQISVDGDFVLDSVSANPYLTAGRLVVKGDFIQQATGFAAALANFNPAGLHQVVLAGDKAQTVQLANTEHTAFNRLELVNTSTAGVKFTSAIQVLSLFQHHQRPFHLADAEHSHFVDFDGDQVNDHLDGWPDDATHHQWGPVGQVNHPSVVPLIQWLFHEAMSTKP